MASACSESISLILIRLEGWTRRNSKTAGVERTGSCWTGNPATSQHSSPAMNTIRVLFCGDCVREMLTQLYGNVWSCSYMLFNGSFFVPDWIMLYRICTSCILEFISVWIQQLYVFLSFSLLHQVYSKCPLLKLWRWIVCTMPIGYKCRTKQHMKEKQRQSAQLIFQAPAVECFSQQGLRQIFSLSGNVFFY